MKRLVVLDTNCLIQMLSRRSAKFIGWDAFRKGLYNLCVSNEILSEYQEIIGKKASPAVAQNVVSEIIHSPYTVFVDPQYRFHLVEQDYDDNKFVDCAFAANATYIVSDDKHYDVLKEVDFPQILVLKLKEFLGLLQSDENRE
jgi:putative PIN family toxin of toxin-antitoxin system